MEQTILTKAAIEECAKNVIGMEARCIEWGASAERSVGLAVEEITKFVSALQSTPPEQRADISPEETASIAAGLADVAAGRTKPLSEVAAHPEAVRMPIELEEDDVELRGLTLWRVVGSVEAGLIWQPVADIRQLLTALTELQTERAAHERTKEELEITRAHHGSTLLRLHEAAFVKIPALEAELESLRSERK